MANQYLTSCGEPVAKEGKVHYNQPRDYKALGVAGTRAGHGMTGQTIMLPISVFFRRIAVTTYATLFLFCAASHAEEDTPPFDGPTEISATDREEPSPIPPAEIAPQLPEPRQPDEIIFEMVRKKALESGKEGLLDKYLKDSPTNRFGERARAAIDEIHFRRYRAENSLRAYTIFIVNEPDSRYAAEAGQRVDDLLFAPVSRENTIEGYMIFIETFPDHPLVPAAQAAIEDLIFDEVKQADSIIAWAEFLRDHAASERAAEGLAFKDELEYGPFKKRDAEEGYREFIRGFPVNRHRAEAYSRMMVLRTARVKRETDAICAEAKMEGSFNCDFVAFEEGTLRVKIVRLSGEEQGQHLLMGGPGYAEEALRRYSDWKNETIKRLLRILSVISVTVE